MPDHHCPKCQAGMEEGFIVDNTYGGRTVSQWIEGAPQRSIWLGLSLKNRRTLEVTTFRCTSCGYLEGFAAQAKGGAAL